MLRRFALVLAALWLGAGCSLLAEGQLADKPGQAGGAQATSNGGSGATSGSCALGGCGACGEACDLENAVAICAAGACAIESCLGAFSDCNGAAADGCEIDTASDAMNCGLCGEACSVAHGVAACVASSCAVAGCTPPFGDCDGDVANGCEVDTSSDLDHCGACGERCKAQNGAATCAGGACVLSCAPGFADCDGDPSDGCEASLDLIQSCGSCGNACPEGRNCAGGACKEGWLGMSTVNAPPARMMAAAAWIGSGVFVWGGSSDGTNLLADGAIYDNHADTWSAIGAVGAPAARVLAGAAWTGTRVVVWGGADASGGAAFATGARYAPLTGAWSTMSAANAPPARQQPILVSTGKHVIVWGGSSAGAPVPSGARYDDESDSWLPMSSAGAPSPRLSAAVAWTGAELMVFGGRDGATLYNDLHAYDPWMDQWRSITPSGAPPSARYDAFVVWMDGKLFVWNGTTTSTIDESGFVYDAAANAWSTAGGGKPSKRAARVGQSGWPAWSPIARVAVVLGGADGANLKKDGGVFDPAANAWGAAPGPWPSGVTHEWGVAVWTGQEMILWSGTTDGTAMTPAGDRYMP